MSGKVRLGLGLVLVLVLALMLAGCQPATKSVEIAPGVKVDQTGENVTVTGPDGSTTTIGKSLPVGMPTDFPVYKGTVTSSSKSKTSEGTSFTFSVETVDSVQAISDWYDAELTKAGWTIESTWVGGDTGSEASMLSATKGTSQAYVNAGTSDGKTTVAAVLVVQ
jgi:hypothetical protein